MVDLQFGLQEPLAQQSQEPVHVLEHIAGVFRVSLQRLSTQTNKLKQNRMQILVLDGPLPELINLGSFMEVVEDASEVLIVWSLLQIEIGFNGLA